MLRFGQIKVHFLTHTHTQPKVNWYWLCAQQKACVKMDVSKHKTNILNSSVVFKTNSDVVVTGRPLLTGCFETFWCHGHLCSSSVCLRSRLMACRWRCTTKAKRHDGSVTLVFTCLREGVGPQQSALRAAQGSANGVLSLLYWEEWLNVKLFLRVWVGVFGRLV